LVRARYVGARGAAIGIDSFGASAPYPDLYAHFGITVDAIVRAAERVGQPEREEEGLWLSA